jgi:hypothetical protein
MNHLLLTLSLLYVFCSTTYNNNVDAVSPSKIAQYCKPTPSINLVQCNKRIAFCKKFGIDLVWVGPATSCPPMNRGNSQLPGSGGCQCGKHRQDYCGFTCETECNNRPFCKWSGAFCKFADGSEWIPPTGNTCAKATFCVPGSIPSLPTSCYTGTPGTEGIGDCVGGVLGCNNAGTAFDDCIGEVVDAPFPDCQGDGDADCNGSTDALELFCNCC